jgi:hypothetical protein
MHNNIAVSPSIPKLSKYQLKEELVAIVINSKLARHRYANLQDLRQLFFSENKMVNVWNRLDAATYSEC